VKNNTSPIQQKLNWQFIGQLSIVVIFLLILAFGEYSLVKLRNLSQLTSLNQGVNIHSYQFLNKEITKDELIASIDDVYGKSGKMYKQLVDSLKNVVNQINYLKLKNDSIKGNVQFLTNNSLSLSHQFLINVSRKLENPATASSVSVLEKKVIAGASANSVFTNQICRLFVQLEQNLEKKDSLLQLLDFLVENSKIDFKRLAGTEFASLPANAIKTNQSVKQLVIEYVDNKKQEKLRVAQLFLLEKQINTNISSYAGSRIKSLIITIITFAIFGIIFIFIVGGFVIVFSYQLRSLLGKYLESSLHTYQKLGQGIFDTSSLEKIKNREDELGQLSSSLFNVIEKLGKIINTTGENIAVFKTSAKSISESSVNLSKNTSQEAISMEETSASIEEMTANLEAMAHNSALIKSQMSETNDRINVIAKVIDKLAHTLSQTIKKSLVIGDISRKVDILAINAAIEAARAGDSGAGFSVIAEEIRKLADMTQQSAAEIQTMASQGEKDSRNSISLANAIVPQMNKMYEGVAELANSIEEIKSGAGQISSSTSILNNSTQENAQLAEELAQTVEVLNSQIKELEMDTQVFQNQENDTLQSMLFNQIEDNNVEDNNETYEQSPEENTRNEMKLDFDYNDVDENDGEKTKEEAAETEKPEQKTKTKPNQIHINLKDDVKDSDFESF